MMVQAPALHPASLPPVSGVTTPTIQPGQSLESQGISQKDTTFTKLFVGGLPYHTSDKSLREHFEVFGEIEEAVVINDRQTGKSRGYGFVIMADRAGAERAIKEPNPVIDGRKANVNLAFLGAKNRTVAAVSEDSLYGYPLGFRLPATTATATGTYIPQYAYMYHPYLAHHMLPFATTHAAITPGTAATLGTASQFYDLSTTNYLAAAAAGYPTSATTIDHYTAMAAAAASAASGIYPSAAAAAAAAAINPAPYHLYQQGPTAAAGPAAAVGSLPIAPIQTTQHQLTEARLQ